MAGKTGAVAPGYRAARLEALKRWQNADGGWGYVPGKQSWLEPTCYSLLALLGEPAAAGAVERGWALMRSWQSPGGGWPPAAAIPGAAWVTALGVTVHCARRRFDDPFRRGLGWLVETKGNEGSLLERVLCLIQRPPNEFDRTLKGWPWRPDSASWVEPTSHALVALKLAIPHASAPEAAVARRRVEMAEAMLLDRRSVDGGWNYGNRRVLETNLPAYPETTGLALLALQGSRRFDSAPAIALAEKMWRETASPLARAWLGIALRNYGVALPEPAGDAAPGQDLLLIALEAMACPGGGHLWFRA